MNDDGRGVGLIKLAESLVLSTTDWWTLMVLFLLPCTFRFNNV